MTKSNKSFTAAAALLLTLALVAGACQRATTSPEAVAEDRPPESTETYSQDLPEGFLDAEELREQEALAEAAERERALEQREVEVAAREAEVAARQARTANQASRAPAAPASAPAPVAEAPAAAQAAPPPLPPVLVSVPAQTEVTLELLDTLTTEGSQPGDFVRGRVASPVNAGGVDAIPAGSRLSGSVTESRSPGKIGGRARLVVHFDRLELPWGDVVPVSLTFAEEGRDESSRDAAKIAGGAAGGAVLGRVLKRGDSKQDQRKAAAIGAVLGAAVGTTIAARTAGEEVEIPAGSTLGIPLASSLHLSVPHQGRSAGAQ